MISIIAGVMHTGVMKAKLLLETVTADGII
jgi:hypothetical protein